MSYVGRVEIRVHKEGNLVELLSLEVRKQRGVRWDPIIEEIGVDGALLKDLLAGRTDGVHDITGAYHEHYSQDYWGEWDADFWLEGERIRFRGPLLEDLS